MPSKTTTLGTYTAKFVERRLKKMNRQGIDRMNKALYREELDHKAKVYDGVKHTLKLCQTMIKALDPTTDPETQARDMLISYLELARQYAVMSASDVTLERCKVKK